jgi:uncharacterized protein YkwD
MRRFRPLLGLLVVLCALAAFVVARGEAARVAHSTPVTSRSAAALVDSGVLEELNQIRAAHHLVPLRLSPRLSAAASFHSRDMLEKGFFSHSSSNGQVFWKRIETFYPEGRFSYWSVGENLFWTTGAASATVSMKAWMASPGHRANILNPAWREIGISSLTSTDAPGAYGGTDATVITTDFGVRR